MPFPESKRVIYRNNPLTEVICQLRFPTILEISSEDPADFQKRVRAKYPLYSRDDPGILLPKEISGLLAGLPIPRRAEDLTHKFLTEDSKKFISLNREFLAVTDKEYRRWEQFRQDIQLAQEALEGVYHPAFYSRIGLRYKDMIDKNRLGLKDDAWDSLVNPSFIGMLGASQLRDKVQEIRSEVLIRLDDIPGSFVRIRHGLTGSSEDRTEAYLIDVDFFTEDRRAIGNVSHVLATFNRMAGNLFRWAITPRLQSALEPTDVD